MIRILAFLAALLASAGASAQQPQGLVNRNQLPAGCAAGWVMNAAGAITCAPATAPSSLTVQSCVSGDYDIYMAAADGQLYRTLRAGCAAPSPTLAFTALANGTAGGSPIVGSGTYTISAPSGLVSATWGGGCSGSSTVTGFSAGSLVWSASFTPPSSSGSGCTLTVTGTGSNTASATSPGVTIAAGALGITLANPGTQHIPSGSTTMSVGLTATLANYSSAPLLNYSLNGAGYAATSGWTINTTSASGNVPSVAGGAAVTFTLRDNAGTPTSNTVTVRVDNAAFASQPSTTGTVGTPLASSGTVNCLGLTTAYAGMLTSALAADGARTPFPCGTGSAVPALTPGAAGTEYVGIFDAATSGNMLAQSGAITVSAGSSYTGPADVAAVTATYGQAASAATLAGGYRAYIITTANAGTVMMNLALSTTTGFATVPTSGPSGQDCTVTPCYVAEATDTSVNGTGANVVFASGFRPQLAVVNGHPCMRAVTSSSGHAFATMPSQPLTLSAVVRRDTVTSGSNVMSVGNATTSVGMPNTVNSANAYAGSVLGPYAMSDGVLHSMTASFNGASSFERIDATAQAAGNAGTNAVSGDIYLMNDSGGNGLLGYECAAVVFPSALSSGATGTLRAQHVRDWGTP